MSWKEQSQMDEKMSFIAKLLDGESMSDLCKEFGISRKTGYKFLKRYKNGGPPGLLNRSSRPHHLANLITSEVKKLIIAAKQKRPSWGAAKIRILLIRDYPNLQFPSKNTIHAVLDSEGMVKKRRMRFKRQPSSQKLIQANQPNELWCADYKGQFKLKNNQYCYPLTISDFASRYLIACDSHEGTQLKDAYATFEEAFETYGLPDAIRTDNGSPFACLRSLHGLTKLSAWWLSLGIKIERIAPGCPQQNGRHERIHKTMKLDPIITDPEKSLMKQQDSFNLFREEYNQKRPHESLAMKCPSDIYTNSERKYKKELILPDYQDCDAILRVSTKGNISHQGKNVFLSEALTNFLVGCKIEEDDIMAIRFMDLELGFFDLHEEIFFRSDE